MQKERIVQLDIFKGFSILAIVFWHAGIIPTWSFVWAIPTFVFTTAALYNNALDKVSFKKICISILWIFGLIGLFTVVFYYVGLPQIGEWESISLSPTFWILRNPYLANLWYFLLYFQILFALLLLKTSRFNINNLKKWWIGIGLFLFGECVSYFLLWQFGKGVTVNVFSWSFLIWSGLLFYADIKLFFRNLYTNRKVQFYLSNALIIIFIAVVLFLGGSEYQTFLANRTHDFIFPTFLIQIAYFYLLFSISTIIIDRFKYFSLFFAMVGKSSLYIYLFHACISIIFLKPFGIWGFILSIPISMILGYLLNKLFIFLKRK
jgi:hypothetical protein